MGVDGNTVTIGGNPGWTANAFAPANGFSQYILIVLDDVPAPAGSLGTQGGWWTITGNTADAVVVNPGSDNLAAMLVIVSRLNPQK